MGSSHYFLYAGTHDNCDHWLTHHRDFKIASTDVVMPEAAHVTSEAPTACASDDAPSELDYDDIVLKDLDEPMLRRIFRGLCGA